MCVPGAHRRQNRESDAWEATLQTVVSCHVGATTLNLGSPLSVVNALSCLAISPAPQKQNKTKQMLKDHSGLGFNLIVYVYSAYRQEDQLKANLRLETVFGNVNHLSMP